VYRLKSPLRVNLELTEACNNACVHCYNFWRYQETGERAAYDDRSRSYEHFEKMLNVIIDQEVRTVTFTGGEPFLRKDVLFPLVAKAKQAGLRVLINTNATLITPHDVDQLKRLRVDGYLVSLLCADEETHNAMTNANSYTKTMQTITRLVASDQSVAVNMVISRDNLRFVRKTAQIMSDMGAYSFSATPMLSCYLSAEHEKINLSADQVKQVLRDLVWARGSLPIDVTVLDTVVYCMFTKEERIEFDGILGARYCCAGISDCALSPDGDLRPCILSTDVGGNILTDGWEKAWDNLGYWKAASMIPPECLTCAEVGPCGGGCRSAAKAKCGSYTGKDPYMTTPILQSPISHPPLSSPRKDLRDSDALSARTGLVWRTEPFGATIFNEDECVFLKEGPATFLKSLIDSGRFSVNSVCEGYGIDKDDVRSFMQTLVDEGYLLVEEVNLP
jgi:radical SAM protein with 4Fe4S-binding SPASM domain